MQRPRPPDRRRPLAAWRMGVGFAALAAALGCTRDISLGSDSRRVVDGGAAGAGGSSIEAAPDDAVAAGGAACTQATCDTHLYDCGDCLDNDGDGLIDSDDPDCLGPCQNAEDTFYGSIPGQSGNSCNEDCYFDQDRGVGNDGCVASRVCDPLEPEGSRCAHSPAARECANPTPQSAACVAACGPLTPNGCDCFGCCNVPGASTPVWVGSTDETGAPSCDSSQVADPLRCRPCTQDLSCLNPCEPCELCVGKRTLPAACGDETCVAPLCPDGATPCGLPCLPSCRAGFSCITGCCVAIIR